MTSTALSVMVSMVELLVDSRLAVGYRADRTVGPRTSTRGRRQRGERSSPSHRIGAADGPSTSHRARWPAHPSNRARSVESGGRGQPGANLAYRRAAGPVGADRAGRGAVPDQVNPRVGDHPGAVHRDTAARRAQPAAGRDGRARPGSRCTRGSRPPARTARPTQATPSGVIRSNTGSRSRTPRSRSRRTSGVTGSPVTPTTLPGGRPARTASSTRATAARPSSGPNSSSLNVGRAAGHPGGGGRDGGDLAEQLHGRGAAADHHHAPAGELGRPPVVGGVQLPSPEGRPAGVVRPERPGPGAGGVDQSRGRSRCPGRCARPAGRRGGSAPPGPAPAAAPAGRTPLVRGEVGADLLGGRAVRVGGRERQPGQVVEAVHPVEPQRRPAVLPGAARPVVAVEDARSRCRARSRCGAGGSRRDRPACPAPITTTSAEWVSTSGYNAPDVAAVPVPDRLADHRRPFRLRPPDLHLR